MSKRPQLEQRTLQLKYLTGFVSGVVVTTGLYFFYSLYLRLVVLEAFLTMINKLMAGIVEAMAQ